MVETPRLIIHPLNLVQLKMYIQNDGSLEKELGLFPTPTPPTQEEIEAVEELCVPMLVKFGDDYPLYTPWIVIHKEQNIIVGSLSIYGPGSECDWEVGGAIDNLFQRQGLMSEILQAMIPWFKSQEKVKLICAITDKDNIASHRVLQKNGFVLESTEYENWSWELYLNNS
jgi:[ribosomal protein S5]-alanine N-acetyltransferase